MKIEHFAFNVSDPVVAGIEVFPDDTSHLMMLRGPWGVALQRCNRSCPLEK